MNVLARNSNSSDAETRTSSNPMFVDVRQAYRRDIDGLRAFAVLAVMFYHGFPNVFQGGYIGVDVFFVISGFLISSILFHEIDGTLSFERFYARRIRRIFPALVLLRRCWLTASSLSCPLN